MATLDWPQGRAFQPRRCSWGVSSPRSSFGGFYSGQVLSTSHLADRMMVSIVMPPVSPPEAALREAFFVDVVSAGHLLRMGHLTRREPLGTMRGTPALGASAAAGARSITVSSAAPNATLLGGDLIGVSGQLLMVAYTGCVFNGSGIGTVPLALPLVAALSNGASVTWQSPTTTFQLQGNSIGFDYGRGAWQGEVELSFRQWA